MYTVTAPHEERLLSLQRVVSDVRSILSSSSVLYTHGREVIETRSPLTQLLQVEYGSSLDRIHLGIIRSAALRAESAAGGGGRVTTLLTCHLIESIRKQSAAGYTPAAISSLLAKECEDHITSLQSAAVRASLDDALSLCARGLPDLQGGAVAEAVRLAGANGKIHLLKEVGGAPIVVELVDGYTWNLNAPLSLSNETAWKHHGVRTLVVDGVIDSMSEVDRLFQDAHTTSEPLLIIARGFNQDVCSTITANRYRKTLNAHCLEVPYDVHKVNLINDIAIACGTTPVSSLAGQVISTQTLSDLPRVEMIGVLGPRLTITNPASSRAVNAHVADLSERRDGAGNDEVYDMLDERIRSLTATRVEVRVGGSPREAQAGLESLDGALRTFRSALGWGILRLDDVEMNSGQVLHGHTIRKCIFHSGDVQGALGAARAIREAYRVADTLGLSSGMVLQDR